MALDELDELDLSGWLARTRRDHLEERKDCGHNVAWIRCDTDTLPPRAWERDKGGELELSDEPLPYDVERFAIKQGLLHYLVQAIGFAKNAFPRSAPVVQLESDPDSDDEWIAITVSTGLGIAEALEQESKFNDQRIAGIPWPQRDKIRIICDILHT